MNKLTITQICNSFFCIFSSILESTDVKLLQATEEYSSIDRIIEIYKIIIYN